MTSWGYLRAARANALPAPADLNPPDGLDAANVPTGRPMPTGLPIPIGLLITTGLLVTIVLFIKIGEWNPKPNRGPMKNG